MRVGFAAIIPPTLAHPHVAVAGFHAGAHGPPDVGGETTLSTPSSQNGNPAGSDAQGSQHGGGAGAGRGSAVGANDFRFLGVLLLLMALIVGLVFAIPRKHPDPLPTPVSPRHLATEPELYEGRRVLLSTSAFQVEPGRVELAYRPLVPGKPSVVIRFDGPVPDPVPHRVSGVPTGRDPVVVAQVRPD